MNKFDLASSARRLPEDTWVAVTHLRAILQSIKTYSRKVSGVGGWALLVIIFAMGAGLVMAGITKDLVHHRILVEAYRSSPLPWFFWSVLIGLISYGLIYHIQGSRFGMDLQFARNALNEMRWNPKYSDTFFSALYFIEQCEPELMEFVNKSAMRDFKKQLSSLKATPGPA